LIIGRGNQYYKRIDIDDHIKLPVEYIKKVCDNLSPFIANNFQAHRVAHAGGAFGGRTYCNSIDALKHNIKNGFMYFELDFNFTKDGYLVCIHDWRGSFKSTFGFEMDERPTLEEFEDLVRTTPNVTNCTLDSLTDWLRDNPYTYIVTDVKKDNLRALRIMSEKIPGFEKRIIPQIYQPDNYNSVKEMGYEQVIWTLYRYRGTDNDVLEWVDRFKGPFAVTIPKSRGASNLPMRLAKKDITTYVLTVNTVEEANNFKYEYYVTEIYTDHLFPTELDEYGLPY